VRDGALVIRAIGVALFFTRFLDCFFIPRSCLERSARWRSASLS
jgi:hypothetical protein